MILPPASLRTISSEADLPSLSDAARALWHDARGDWAAAHRIVQDLDGADAAWVHAYLHRKEGDLSNAAYWYRRAGKPVASDDGDAEWERIAQAVLG